MLVAAQVGTAVYSELGVLASPRSLPFITRRDISLSDTCKRILLLTSD